MSATAARRGPDTELIGDITLHGVLARGGQGRVLRAFCASHGWVALKLFHGTAAKVRKAAAREATILEAIAGPGVPELVRHGLHEGIPFIAMSLVEGTALSECHAFSQPLPAELVIELLGQVCEPLARLHRLGWVHADIKPPNLMLDDAGVVTLVDFGAAHPRGGRPIERNSAAMGPLLGTPHYAAPELFDDSGVLDPTLDVYALGMIAYELLTARIPFTPAVPFATAFEAWCGNAARWRHAHREIAPAPITQTPALAVSRGLERLVMACLAKDPAERPADADTVAAWIRTRLED